MAQDGRSVYLLGGNEGVAEQAAQSLKVRFPGLKIAGTFYPPFGFEKDQDAVEQIRTAIRESQPDVVYVALGSPKQEELIARLRPDFRKCGGWGLASASALLRAKSAGRPIWMQRLGWNGFIGSFKNLVDWLADISSTVLPLQQDTLTGSFLRASAPHPPAGRAFAQ